MRIAGPRLLLLDGGLRGLVVLEDGVGVRSGSGRVHGDDVVLDLPCLAGDHRRGRRRLHLFPRPRPFPLRPSLLSLRPASPSLTSLPSPSSPASHRSPISPAIPFSPVLENFSRCRKNPQPQVSADNRASVKRS